MEELAGLVVLVAAGEVVTAAGVAVVEEEPAAEGAVELVPLAVPPVVLVVPAAPEDPLDKSVVGAVVAPPAALPDDEPPVADAPLELSVEEGVAALGDEVAVDGEFEVVALSVDCVDCAPAKLAAANTAAPIMSFRRSVDMVISPVKKRGVQKATQLLVAVASLPVSS